MGASSLPGQSLGPLTDLEKSSGLQELFKIAADGAVPSSLLQQLLSRSQTAQGQTGQGDALMSKDSRLRGPQRDMPPGLRGPQRDIGGAGYEQMEVPHQSAAA